MRTPRTIEVPDGQTLPEMIADLDKEYVKATQGDGQNHKADKADTLNLITMRHIPLCPWALHQLARPTIKAADGSDVD